MNAADSKGILRSYAGRGDTVVSYLESDRETRSTFTSANVSGLIQGAIDGPEEGDAPA
jgi:hypothetical protein